MSRYNEILFKGKPSPERHPNSFSIPPLLLYGMTSKDPQNSRILEIACGSGDNLCCIAWGVPNATCVGIDTAEGALAQARSEKESLGLKNITFYQIEVENLLQKRLPPFDYIICSGLFSWVPEEMQIALLKSIKESLAPEGLCYLNYNCLPAWQERAELRQALREHIDLTSTPSEQIKKARYLISLRMRPAPRLSDAYIYHELLADHVSAYTLSELSTLCEEQGLLYLCDSVFSGSAFHKHSIATRGAILVHSQQLQESLHPELVSKLWISSLLVPETPKSFLAPDGALVPVDDQAFASYLTSLWRRWPEASACDPRFYSQIVKLYELQFARLYRFPPQATKVIKPRPLAAPYSRSQATRQSWVTNSRHEYVELEKEHRKVLGCLDGSMTHIRLQKECGVSETRLRQILEELSQGGLLI